MTPASPDDANPIPIGEYSFGERGQVGERHLDDISIGQCSSSHLPSLTSSCVCCGDEEFHFKTIAVDDTPFSNSVRSCRSPDSVIISSDDYVRPQLPLCTSSLDAPHSTRTGDHELMKNNFECLIANEYTNADIRDAQPERPTQTPTGSTQCAISSTPTRRVSFADEWGTPLKQVRLMEPPPFRRIVLLLLSPEDRKFEFLNLEYPLDDSTTVQIVLEQVPKLVANPVFRMLSLSCLARTSKNEKLDNRTTMADCELADNELLLGVSTGYSMNQIGAFAVPLLLNGNIIKAVNRAKRSGKGLKTIKSGKEWRRRGKWRKSPKSSPKKAEFPIGSPSSSPEALHLDIRLADAASPEAKRDLFGASERESSFRNDELVAQDGDVPKSGFDHGIASSDILEPTASSNECTYVQPLDQSNASNAFSSKQYSSDSHCDNSHTSEDMMLPVTEDETHSESTAADQEVSDAKVGYDLGESKDPSSYIFCRQNLPEGDPRACIEADISQFENNHIDKPIRNSLEANARSVVDQLVCLKEYEIIEAPGAANSAFKLKEISMYESADDDCSSSSSSNLEDVPDMDHDGECRNYPDFCRDFLGEQDRAEKAVFWIHAVSIAAVGYLTTFTMG